MRLLFLDRDGVINRFPGMGAYVTGDKGLKLLPNALRGIRLLTRAGFRLVVISNQGCVSRGMITRAELRHLTDKMLNEINASDGKVHRVYYCMHQTSDRCRCKKPKTLLMERAVRGLRLPRREVYFIGDSREDVEAGKRFGCRTILVLSGRSKKRDIKDFSIKPDLVKKNLLEAAQWILRKKS